MFYQCPTFGKNILKYSSVPKALHTYTKSGTEETHNDELAQIGDCGSIVCSRDPGEGVRWSTGMVFSLTDLIAHPRVADMRISHPKEKIKDREGNITEWK